MLNFFVLGLIPGTNLQITFTWFLILGIIADVSFGLAYLYFVLWLKKSGHVGDAASEELVTGQTLA